MNKEKNRLMEKEFLTQEEEQEYYLLIQELLQEVQVLKKDIVNMRMQVNELWAGDNPPFPEPASDLPGQGLGFMNYSIMRGYEDIFGPYIPEY